MSKLLKDQIDRRFVESLADRISGFDSGFQKSRFIERLFYELDWRNLELKQRIRTITESLGNNLGGSFQRQIKILKEVAPETEGLGAMIFPDFVEVHGLDQWDISIEALKFFTPFFSSEFAVRPFIVKDQKRMLATMLEWSKDKNHHVRRLASEGCRPRLPWSFKLRELVIDPSPVFLILENLKSDESLYVRRSVANNLNDISKDHPEVVLRVAGEWIGEDPRIDWVIKTGLRTLFKKGRPEAMALFRLENPVGISVENLRFAKSSFAIGSNVEFEFEVLNARGFPSTIRVDYIIEYVKKNGSHSQKVFRISERTIGPGRREVISRRHSLKQMTTRTHYPGRHHLTIAINGVPLARGGFLVK